MGADILDLNTSRSVRLRLV